MFNLSSKSLDKLVGVDPSLVKVVKRAIQITTIDFAVIEGVRSIERQKELVAKGASQTLASKHIEGKAVDLLAYIDGRGSWELALYDNIADAMKVAAIECSVPIRWGAAWNLADIRKWPGTMEQAMNSYIDVRRKEGKRPFIDAPHFEIN
jgi:peptidoglycan L-alanyl-D-glutamate endopeptidase CwlK